MDQITLSEPSDLPITYYAEPQGDDITRIIARQGDTESYAVVTWHKEKPMMPELLELICDRLAFHFRFVDKEK